MKHRIWLPVFLALLLLCSGCAQKQVNDVVSTEDPKGKGYKSTQKSIPQKMMEADTTVTDTEFEEDDLGESEEQTVQLDKIADIIGRMTLEEKAAQLFVVLPEALIEGVSAVTQAGDATKEAVSEFPVSGFIYMQNNLQSPEQVKEMLSNVQSYSMERIGLPAFLCVDEEGGKVARISGTDNFSIPGFEGMDEVGQSQNTKRAKDIGNTIGEYLSGFGFNVDFAPVADVLSNPQNEVVKQRSFGSDPGLVSDMALAVMEGLWEQGVYASYKHFPGHGMTAGDTHEGYAY